MVRSPEFQYCKLVIELSGAELYYIVYSTQCFKVEHGTQLGTNTNYMTYQPILRRLSTQIGKIKN